MNATEISLEPATPPPGCLAMILAAAFVAGAAQVALVSGCASAPLPDGALEFVTNHIDRVVSGLGGASSVDAQSAQQQPGGDAGDAAGPVSPSPAPAIDWRFGGFNGSKAAEDPATQIRDLRISGDGLSYKWAKGDLGNWGLSRTDAGALACAFWWDGSRWVGGKFDWISTSRLTRDFKNIRDGYHGWNPVAFFGAKRRAFCIMSADGRKRTNLIEEAK